MLSYETACALVLAGCVLSVPFFVDAGSGEWLQFLGLALGVFAWVRAFFYFAGAVKSTRLSSELDRVLLSRSAPALNATLRNTFLAPVIDVPIPDVGVARVRFFADVASVWMRLRLKSPTLDRAPWIHLEGNSNFLAPASVLGANALTPYDPDRHWRYWRLPWRPADCTVEDATFCAALPNTEHTLVLTSRPGQLLIRANCGSDPRTESEREADIANGSYYGRNMEFENMVNLAIAWVKAVQQTAGAPRT